MVGVVSSDRRDAVSEGEVDELTGAYESLRGLVSRERAAAGRFGRITRITSHPDGPDENGACENGAAANGAAQIGRSESARLEPDSSWQLSIGTPHDAGSSGGARLEDLDGQFAWASYDAGADELAVATDPFGMQPVFVAGRNGRTYISTSALALAKHLRARPSKLGVTAFLRTGYQFGSLTNWEGIERLDPGTRIRFGGSGATYETYWKPEIDEPVTRLDLPHAVEHCRSVAVETYRALYAR